MHILAQIADNLLDSCAGDDPRIVLQDPVELSGNVHDNLKEDSYDSAAFCSFVTSTEPDSTRGVHNKYYLSKGRTKIPITAAFDLEPKPYALIQNSRIEERVIELVSKDGRWLKMKFLDAGTFSQWRQHVSKALVEQLCIEAFAPLPSGRLSSVRLNKALQTCQLLTEPTDYIIQRTRHLQEVRERMTTTLKLLRSSPHEVSASSVMDLIELGKTEPILCADPDMTFFSEKLNADSMNSMTKQQLEDVCKSINYDEFEEIAENEMMWELETRCMKSPETSHSSLPTEQLTATPTTAMVVSPHAAAVVVQSEKTSRAHRRSLGGEIASQAKSNDQKLHGKEEILMLSSSALATAVPVSENTYSQSCPDVQFWQDHRTATRMSNASTISSITTASQEQVEQMQSIAGRGKMCIKFNGKDLLSSTRKRRKDQSVLSNSRHENTATTKMPAAADRTISTKKAPTEHSIIKKCDQTADGDPCTAAELNHVNSIPPAAAVAEGSGTAKSLELEVASDENHNSVQKPTKSGHTGTPKRRQKRKMESSTSSSSGFHYTDRRKALTPRAPRSTKKQIQNDNTEEATSTSDDLKDNSDSNIVGNTATGELCSTTHSVAEPAVSLTLTRIGKLSSKASAAPPRTQVLTPEILREGRNRLVQSKKVVAFNSTAERFPTNSCGTAKMKNVPPRRTTKEATAENAPQLQCDEFTVRSGSVINRCGDSDGAVIKEKQVILSHEVKSEDKSPETLSKKGLANIARVVIGITLVVAAVTTGASVWHSQPIVPDMPSREIDTPIMSSTSPFPNSVVNSDGSKQIVEDQQHFPIETLEETAVVVASDVTPTALVKEKKKVIQPALLMRNSVRILLMPLRGSATLLRKLFLGLRQIMMLPLRRPHTVIG